jgi:hypothetical protein
MNPIERTAACECGALTLAVTGNPVHAHACACANCQRTSGSVMTFQGWFPAENVRVEGDTSVWYFRGPDQPDFAKFFCPTCGGGGYFTTGDNFPGTFGICIGTFGDNTFPAPKVVFWWSDRPHWLAKPDGVPVVDEYD